MITDASRVKFVNGKFILSTNDKSNPVQIVRQKEAGNDNDVIIHLSDGTQFDDRIKNFKGLVGLTSNKLYGFTFELQVNFSKEWGYIDYIDKGKFINDHDGLIAQELKKFEDTLIELMTNTYQLSDVFSGHDSIVKPEERVWITTVAARSINDFIMPHIVTNSRGDTTMNYVYGDFSILYCGLVLCPNEAIEEFLERGSEYLQLSFRRMKPPARICQRHVYGRNYQLVEKTVDDFFTADFDVCNYSLAIQTDDKKYFEKKFTDVDDFDIIDFFNHNLNGVIE